MTAVLLIPFLSLCSGAPPVLDSSALRQAARFLSFRGSKESIYWLYQLSSAVLLLSLFFASVHTVSTPLFWNETALYASGLLLLLPSVIGFAAPPKNGVCRKGAYRTFRNPVHVSHFSIFPGCVFLTQSLPPLAAPLVFQFAAHTVIRVEERWCHRTSDAVYECCCGSVRRHL